MNSTQKKILITGITGMVGSHLADHIIKFKPNWKIYGCCRWRSDVDNINQTLGLTGQDVIQQLYLHMIKGEIKEALEVLSASYKKGANPQTICDDLIRITYYLIHTLASNVKNIISDLYDKDKINVILENSSIFLLNQFWQMLLKGKEEISNLSLQIEALEVLIIRISFSAKLPQVENIVEEIKKNKNSEFKENIDNIELGNDIKKILKVFPESRIIEDNN